MDVEELCRPELSGRIPFPVTQIALDSSDNMSHDHPPLRPHSHMDAIPTHQSLAYLAFFAGRMDEKELVQNARATVVLRYRAAIRRYLGGWFQVADADDLAQEV